MWSDATQEAVLDAVADQLRQATALTPSLVREVIARACLRTEAMRSAGKAKTLDRLVEDCAWCDVALALIELELPAWSVRRLLHEDGEWFCSLSKDSSLPLGLDDTADSSHHALPLAILGAFVEAKRRVVAKEPAGRSLVPQMKPAPAAVICCENFS